MTEKEILISILNRLPDEVSFSKIKDEFEVLSALQEAGADIDAGRTKTHEEVKSLFKSWVAN